MAPATTAIASDSDASSTGQTLPDAALALASCPGTLHSWPLPRLTFRSRGPRVRSYWPCDAGPAGQPSGRNPGGSPCSRRLLLIPVMRQYALPLYRDHPADVCRDRQRAVRLALPAWHSAKLPGPAWPASAHHRRGDRAQACHGHGAIAGYLYQELRWQSTAPNRRAADSGSIRPATGHRTARLPAALAYPGRSAGRSAWSQP